MRTRRTLAFALAVVVAAALAAPLDPAAALEGDITKHPIADVGDQQTEFPSDMVLGADGNLWFAAYHGLNRFEPDGTVTSYTSPDLWYPRGLTVTPDGAIWFVTPTLDRIGRFDPDGTFTFFPDPDVEPVGTIREPEDLTVGPDGNLWFTSRDNNRIGRMTPAGDVTLLPSQAGVLLPDEIVTGPDGNLWVASRDGLVRVTPGGTQTLVPVHPDRIGGALTVGPDGRLWFGDRGWLGAATTDGVVTAYPNLELPDTSVSSIARGPDARLWVGGGDGTIFNATLDGEVVAYSVGSGASTLIRGMTAAPDGLMWFTMPNRNAIGSIDPGPPVQDPDLVAPTVDLVAPSDHDVHVQGDVVAADFSCADDGGSLLVRCEGTVADGAPIDTATVGWRHFEVEAEDGDDNLATATASYVVVDDEPAFSDVPPTHPFYDEVQWMSATGTSTGFPGGTYRPSEPVTRQAMSAFLHRLAGAPAFVPDGPSFTDVSADHPFYEEIEWMAAEGISTGYQPGATYRPDALVTRQAMSAFMHRLAGEPPVDLQGSTFFDVGEDHPFYVSIEWMAAEGISTGYQPGATYRPDAPVTRQAMSAFMARLAPLLPVPTPSV